MECSYFADGLTFRCIECERDVCYCMGGDCDELKGPCPWCPEVCCDCWVELREQKCPHARARVEAEADRG